MANERPQSKGRMVELFIFINVWSGYSEMAVHDGGNILIIGTQQCKGGGGAALKQKRCRHNNYW